MSTSEQIELTSRGNGVWAAPGARIVDRSGRKMLPIGRDGFVPAMQDCVVVDKTMLIADVLDSGYAVTLFCRPRRFGKTLNMTMMKAFFEQPEDSGLNLDELFEGTEVWEADGGRYREYLGAYPVVHFSFNTVKKLTWDESRGAIYGLIQTEYARHRRLDGSDALLRTDAALYERIVSGTATQADYAASLEALCRMLRAEHGRQVVVLIDEYDAPVMAGYTNGYYREVVDFLKGWLTGALKDGGAALKLACLTGVQRVTKESIFSDLNNLFVSTALSSDFDERYGFVGPEVAALGTYLGHADCLREVKEWYDGYRFGESEVYNPWSLLNYYRQGCTPDVYWGNTSSNSVIGHAVNYAGPDTLAKLYRLLEPGGTVAAALELGTVFPDVGVREGALWSMLYLAGYLTTDLTAAPNDSRLRRPLRIPNKEISRLFRGEVIDRFSREAGGDDALDELHQALVEGDEQGVDEALGRVMRTSPSVRDLVSENSVHMLLTGLLYGVAGYGNPISNREAGRGYYDLRLEPLDLRPEDPEGYYAATHRPLITVEVKFSKDSLDGDGLQRLAREGLAQIASRGYDQGPLPSGASGRLHWGIAFSGKDVAAVCERP